jgi:hypothetical protein
VQNTRGYWAAAAIPSLFVVLNRSDVSNAGGFRILARDSFRPTLAEKIPALVQILFELAAPLSTGLGRTTLGFLPEEFLLLVHQLVDPLSNVLIFHPFSYRSQDAWLALLIQITVDH